MLELRQARKTYRKGDRTIHAVEDLDIRAEQGEVVIIAGPSGSGKSTLLLMAGGMLRPDGGQVLWEIQIVDGRVAASYPY